MVPKKISQYYWKLKMITSDKKVSELIPYANNARIHSEQQVKQIAASIQEFGFINPVIIDKSNGIIAGHGRVMAAELLGIEEVPCVIVEGLTEAQKKAYILADNQLALNASWDYEMLKIEVERIQELDFDVEVIGFDDDIFNIFYPKDSEQSPVVEDEGFDSFDVLVSFESEFEQKDFYEKIKSEGMKCKIIG